jgi:hypothetical protein
MESSNKSLRFGPDELAKARETLSTEGRIVARQKLIDQGALDGILGSAPRTTDGKRLFKSVDFTGSTFEGDVNFNGTTFAGPSLFAYVTFNGGAYFEEATFEVETSFVAALFNCDVSFGKAKFHGDAEFHAATFKSMAGFPYATFAREAQFGERMSAPDPRYRTNFEGDAHFDHARFEGHASFGGTTVGGVAAFTRARFEEVQHLGPMLVAGELRIDDAQFAQRAWIEFASKTAWFAGTEFQKGADVRARWGDVACPQVDFAEPSLITESLPAGDASTPFPPMTPGNDGSSDGTALRPRLVSLRQARVADLVVSRMDLRSCLFEGAHRLDAMRTERGAFAAAPSGRRWTARRTLAEEHRWRAETLSAEIERYRSRASEGGGLSAWWAARRMSALKRKRVGWYPPDCRPPEWHGERQRADPAAIAELYRSLRKGFEDRRNEPGAADFYYGEMEMRRNAAGGVRQLDTPAKDRGERWVLWLYWLFSGYGLRASRAFAALAATFLLFAAVLYAVGLKEPDVADAIVQSLEGATLRSGDGELLTSGGQALQVALRLLGPAFLGLALISLRGRVKR